MYRLKSIRYLTTTSLITAVLVIIAYLTSLIMINKTKGILQLSDGLFLTLTIFIKGPMMLISSVLYVLIIDLITGGLIYIPISIIIRILMFLITYFLYKIVTIYVANLLSSLMILNYVFYVYLLYDKTMAIAALISDSIQIVVCYITSIIFSLSLEKTNKISNYRIWDDHKFDKYKPINTKTSSKLSNY